MTSSSLLGRLMLSLTRLRSLQTEFLKHSLPLVYPKVRRQRLGSMLAEIARQEHPDNQSNQKSP